MIFFLTFSQNSPIDFRDFSFFLQPQFDIFLFDFLFLFTPSSLQFFFSFNGHLPSDSPSTESISCRFTPVVIVFPPTGQVKSATIMSGMNGVD